MPSPDVTRLHSEYRKALELGHVRPEDVDEERLDYHVPLLERLDAVEGSSVAVYDLCRMRYAFLTSSFRFLLGYRRDEALEQGPEYFYRQMHPDDLPVVLDTVTRTFLFLHGLPPEERASYKLGFDFRMRQATGDYVRLVQQVVVLEQDRRGAVWLVLIVNDLVQEGTLDAPARRQLRSLRDGKLYLFTPEDEPGGGRAEGNRARLSKRELEVLGLVAVGLASREIADRLFISVATVNNHRQHILEKMHARNCAEAVRYASKLGLLSEAGE